MDSLNVEKMSSKSFENILDLSSYSILTQYLAIVLFLHVNVII